ncbi:MAG: hypothetical protein IJZ85_13270 [Lachnospiraceae bacterium]|nr:hypothetical protein [Lachnospiraceae bacterium]
MNKMYKRVMALLMALTMILSLAACGTPADTDETDAPKTQAPADNQTEASAAETDAPTDAQEFDPRSVCEGVTLTIAVAEDEEVSTWDDNLMTKMIEEELGVELQFEAYASADFLDKINVMVNGGDELPDMIWASGTGSFGNSYLNWAAEEAIIPLNEFYENPDYAKYVNIGSEKAGEDIPSLLANAEGKIYAVPKYFPSPTDTVAQKMWINTEYAKAVGFDEIPTTIEGFYELCKAFKAAGDVNGNGLDDEVCFTGRGDNLRWFNYLMSAFAYAWDDYYLDVTDGNLSFAYTSDEWKEGLKYIKKFMDEGLIDTTALTNDKNAYNAIVMDNEVVVLADLGYYAQMPMTSTDEKNTVRLMYDYVPALAGPNKVGEAYYKPAIAQAGGVITADCENPLAAFLVMDFMCSEVMSISNRYGVQGVNWDYWEDADASLLPEGRTLEMYKGRLASEYPEPIMIPYNDGKFWNTGEPRDTSYMQAGPAISTAERYWSIAVLSDTSTESTKLSTDWNTRYVNSIFDTLAEIPDEHVTRLPMTTDETEDAGKIQTTLDNYVKESIGAFLTGQWDIDTYWDTYLAELDKIGIDEALAIYQTAYDRTK